MTLAPAPASAEWELLSREAYLHTSVDWLTSSIGIFMGFLVGFLLLSILYVGISAVASLQVTYAAFDKDSGASKKQQ